MATETPNKTFAELLNQYRRPGESNSHFGRRMGFNHKIYQEWTKGSVPAIKSLFKLRETLGLSQREYDELVYAAHGFVTRQKDNKTDYAKTDEIISASQLPEKYLARRLIGLKDMNETEREFVERIGLSKEIWAEWLKVEAPEYSTDQMLNIVKACLPMAEGRILAVFCWEDKGNRSVAPTPSITTPTARAPRRRNIGSEKISEVKRRVR